MSKRKEEKCHYNLFRKARTGQFACTYAREHIEPIPRPPHIDWITQEYDKPPCTTCQVYQEAEK